MMIRTLCLTLWLSQAVVNDDRDVIQTAMLSFFKAEEWHSADWTPKHHVVLQTQFLQKSRSDFAVAQEEMIGSRKRTLGYAKSAAAKGQNKSVAERAGLKDEVERANKDIAALEMVRTQMTQGTPYEAPPLIPLKSMAWDSRIIVTDKRNRMVWDKDRDPALEEWTVYARAERPTYSPNGRYAILHLSIPWSIHGSSVTFLFERKEKSWVQVVVDSIFYV